MIGGCIGIGDGHTVLASRNNMFSASRSIVFAGHLHAKFLRDIANPLGAAHYTNFYIHMPWKEKMVPYFLMSLVHVFFTTPVLALHANATWHFAVADALPHTPQSDAVRVADLVAPAATNPTEGPALHPDKVQDIVAGV